MKGKECQLSAEACDRLFSRPSLFLSLAHQDEFTVTLRRTLRFPEFPKEHITPHSQQWNHVAGENI